MTDFTAEARDIHLDPGDVWFGGGMVRLHTVLGSCVSVTLWHPRRHLGGMCHFMLPSRLRGSDPQQSGKYADEAFRFFDAEMARARTSPSEYQAKIFGGGNMFPMAHGRPQGDVGWRNIETARKLLARRGTHVLAEHVGGAGHRKLLFDIWSGDAWLSFRDLRAHAPSSS